MLHCSNPGIPARFLLAARLALELSLPVPSVHRPMGIPDAWKPRAIPDGRRAHAAVRGALPLPHFSTEFQVHAS